MGEPFRSPSTLDLEKMKDLYSDPVIYQVLTNTLNTLNSNPNIDFNDYYFSEWKRLTRLMLLNIPVLFLHEEIIKLTEEIANEQWSNLELPTIENKKKFIYKKEINSRIKISDVARNYNLEFNKRGDMVICPFHKDKDPSMSISDEKGLFHCFGCGISGDIIKFVQLLEELKNGK